MDKIDVSFLLHGAGAVVAPPPEPESKGLFSRISKAAQRSLEKVINADETPPGVVLQVLGSNPFVPGEEREPAALLSLYESDELAVPQPSEQLIFGRPMLFALPPTFDIHLRLRLWHAHAKRGEGRNALPPIFDVEVSMRQLIDGVKGSEAHRFALSPELTVCAMPSLPAPPVHYLLGGRPGRRNPMQNVYATLAHPPGGRDGGSVLIFRDTAFEPSAASGLPIGLLVPTMLSLRDAARAHRRLYHRERTRRRFFNSNDEARLHGHTQVRFRVAAAINLPQPASLQQAKPPPKPPRSALEGAGAPPPKPTRSRPPQPSQEDLLRAAGDSSGASSGGPSGAERESGASASSSSSDDFGLPVSTVGRSLYFASDGSAGDSHGSKSRAYSRMKQMGQKASLRKPNTYVQVSLHCADGAAAPWHGAVGQTRTIWDTASPIYRGGYVPAAPARLSADGDSLLAYLPDAAIGRAPGAPCVAAFSVLDRSNGETNEAGTLLAQATIPLHRWFEAGPQGLREVRLRGADGVSSAGSLQLEVALEAGGETAEEKLQLQRHVSSAVLGGGPAFRAASHLLELGNDEDSDEEEPAGDAAAAAAAPTPRSAALGAAVSAGNVSEYDMVAAEKDAVVRAAFASEELRGACQSLEQLDGERVELEAKAKDAAASRRAFEVEADEWAGDETAWGPEDVRQEGVGSLAFLSHCGFEGEDAADALGAADAAAMPLEELRENAVHHHTLYAMLREMAICARRRLGENEVFRSSRDKKAPGLQSAATNLHVHMLEFFRGGGAPARRDLVSCGAPAAHYLGFKAGGLLRLEREMARLRAEDAGGEAEAASRALQLEGLRATAAVRRVCTVSQSLCAVAAAFASRVVLALEGGRVEEEAARWLGSGFLVYWQGLLSTVGKEEGMIEDAWVSLRLASAWTLQLRLPASGDVPRLCSQLRVEDRAVRLFLPRRYAPAMAGEHAQRLLSGAVAVRNVLLTQGIDIQQSVANRVAGVPFRGQIYGNPRLQADCNAAGVAALEDYARGGSAAAREACRRLRGALEGEGRAKNTLLLREGEAVAELLGGARVTFCKSGKDRTGMAVTLEMTRLLEGEGVNGGEAGAAERSHFCDLLRCGTRLGIAAKNIGRPKYSFNRLQVKYLPRLYRPPPETVENVLSSAMHADLS